ncbi:universal stress protein [Mucilaginibacter gossypii]|uniref:universal stress protein n=1 Tax=Mucilaginibacter gossypii TaxID=551996 RepID=UPI000DCE5E1E|nr:MULTISPECIES: universal stress protein [Mucilaginibacter]QTE38848.1 universal stress protein [Mucilaginibacter gossypii]RAV55076.1 universal stress protein [Mucilaginibacter rubeus]
MKKISAAFDGLKFSQATLDYAIELASRDHMVINGVFLEDFLYHSFDIFDMVGSQGVSGDKLNRLLRKDRTTCDRTIALFEKICAEKQVSYVVHKDKSFAINELIKESIYSDLTVINVVETLNHYYQERPAPFIKEFLAGAQSPVLVVPPVYHSIKRIIILYDGHPSSVFALKTFNSLFPWANKYPAEVVCVSQRPLALLPDGNLIGEYVRCHYDDLVTTQLTGDPEDVLLDWLKKADPGAVVVMGAYSRGAVSRMFNNSMANKLMEVLDLPLFIAHSK